MPTILIIIVSMLTGAALTVAAFWLIERRVLARPVARVEVARRVLGIKDGAR